MKRNRKKMTWIKLDNAKIAKEHESLLSCLSIQAETLRRDNNNTNVVIVNDVRKASANELKLSFPSNINNNVWSTGNLD